MPTQISPRLIAATCGLLLVSGCDWLAGTREPDEAFIEISSDDVDEITLIVSQTFVMTPSPECVMEPECPLQLRLLQADTMTTSVPFTSTVPFTPTLQLYVETFPAEEVKATLSMYIAIDGKVWYDDFRQLRLEDENGERETLSFTYEYGATAIDTGIAG